MTIRLRDMFARQKLINEGAAPPTGGPQPLAATAQLPSGLAPGQCIVRHATMCGQSSCTGVQDTVCAAAAQPTPLHGLTMPLGLGLILAASFIGRKHLKPLHRAALGATALLVAGLWAAPADAVRSINLKAPCNLTFPNWGLSFHWQGEMGTAISYLQSVQNSAGARPNIEVTAVDEQDPDMANLINLAWYEEDLDPSDPDSYLMGETFTSGTTGRRVDRIEISIDYDAIYRWADYMGQDPYMTTLFTYIHELGHGVVLGDLEISGSNEYKKTVMNYNSLNFNGDAFAARIRYANGEIAQIVGDTASCQ